MLPVAERLDDAQPAPDRVAWWQDRVRRVSALLD
jgi:hypothetical protein